MTEPVSNTEQFAEIRKALLLQDGDYMEREMWLRLLLAEVERLQSENERISNLLVTEQMDGSKAFEKIIEQVTTIAQLESDLAEYAENNAELVEGIEGIIRIVTTSEHYSGVDDLRSVFTSAEWSCRDLLALYGGKGDTDAALE